MQTIIKYIASLGLLVLVAGQSFEEYNEIGVEPSAEFESDADVGPEAESEFGVNAHRLPLARCVSGSDCDQRTECSVMGKLS